MSKSEEPPHKKRNIEPSPSSSPLSSLPDDVALNCLARVPRLDHAALSVTSKSCRSLLASHDLYKTRSLMGRTETYVYVCLRSPPPNPSIGWYMLRRRNGGSSSDLIPIASLPSQPPEAPSVVVLDWGIYVIGGLIKGKATSDVWLLDCGSHTWRSVPSMGVARAYAAAGVVDGKIYVFGGCDTVKYGEVFDPKSQTWETLPLHRKKGNKNIHGSVVRDQKVYAVDGTDRTFYYSPSEGKWGRGNRGQVRGNRRDWCMVDDNLLCCLSRNGTIFWCEPDELDWREGEPDGMMDTKEVKGLGSLNLSLSPSRVVHFGERLVHEWDQYKIDHRIPFGLSQELEDLLPGARMSTSGGNILLFWDVIKGDRCLEIWCAEISLQRRKGEGGGDVWGNIEWSNAIVTVDPFIDHYKVLHSVSVAL